MDPIPFVKVSFEDALASPKTEPAHIPDLAPRPAHKHEHAADAPPSRLSLQASIWIDAMPQAMRPHTLARLYPRIANRLAEVWKSELQCEECLNELMLDARGDRQGFPVAVATELASLKAHFIATATTVQFDIWGNRIGLK